MNAKCFLIIPNWQTGRHGACTCVHDAFVSRQYPRSNDYLQRQDMYFTNNFYVNVCSYKPQQGAF